MSKTPMHMQLEHSAGRTYSQSVADFSHFKGNLERFGIGHFYHDVRWQLVARRRSPLTSWNYNKEVIFVHIPKTAGISIYEMFAMDRPYDTHAPVAGYRSADAALFGRAYKFAVIRNPWDRLSSAFHYLKHGTTSSGDKRWEQDEWWSRRYLSDINSFQDFLAALRAPNFRRLVLTWRHFIPQHYFVTIGKSPCLVDQLIRFEDLDSGLEQVAARIGVPMLAIKRNVSKRVGDHPYQNDADIALVRELYARDIELFGYDFPPARPFR